MSEVSGDFYGWVGDLSQGPEKRSRKLMLWGFRLWESPERAAWGFLCSPPSRRTNTLLRFQVYRVQVAFRVIKGA